MIVFATSDKGGTGRSVTSCNIAYWLAVEGNPVCYLDFDFGSPTAGAVFDIESVARGTPSGSGLHSYLAGDTAKPDFIDVWASSDRNGIRSRPRGAEHLTLVPGDEGGGEFPFDSTMVARCRELFARLDEEYLLTLVDLSAGRSYALDMVLSATAHPELRNIESRWLVFHRWTRQHITAAAGLVHGNHGILAAGTDLGLDPTDLLDAVRIVRTAVLKPESPQLASLRPQQAAWLQQCNADLQELAARKGVGRSVVLGEVPLDPILQWREQIITDSDAVTTKVANIETVTAFQDIAKKAVDSSSWEGL